MKTIPEIARLFVGIQEIPGNQGWKEDKFIPKSLVLGQKMNAVGWQKGWAWCMLFAQVISELYLTQFDTTQINVFRKLFTPGAIATFNNFKREYPKMISNSPSENCIAIWQRYTNNKATWQGHAGLYVSLKKNSLTTIDGNTNNQGSRTGEGVFEVTRNIDSKPVNGLRFKGFILLPEFKR